MIFWSSLFIWIDLLYLLANFFKILLNLKNSSIKIKCKKRNNFSLLRVYWDQIGFVSCVSVDLIVILFLFPRHLLKNRFHILQLEGHWISCSCRMSTSISHLNNWQYHCCFLKTRFSSSLNRNSYYGIRGDPFISKSMIKFSFKQRLSVVEGLIFALSFRISRCWSPQTLYDI